MHLPSLLLVLAMTPGAAPPCQPTLVGQTLTHSGRAGEEDPFNPRTPYKTVRVQVEETATGSLMFGLGVNGEAGLTGSIVLNERNFDLAPALDDLIEAESRGR